MSQWEECMVDNRVLSWLRWWYRQLRATAQRGGMVGGESVLYSAVATGRLRMGQANLIFPLRTSLASNYFQPRRFPLADTAST